MVLERATGKMTSSCFGYLERYLNAGDALVVNDTRVFKARLVGRRQSGGAVETLLVRKQDKSQAETWLALVKPSKRLKVGESIFFGDKDSLQLIAENGEGFWKIAFESAEARERIVNRFGHVPLPPYISREDQPRDIRRYQTVFADPDKGGAIAAPTAGFHFTNQRLAHLAEKGVEILKITLHVGPGTFKPIHADNIEDHTVDPEVAELSPDVAVRLNRVRQNGGKLFAVGTTAVRTLESAEITDGEIQPFSSLVDLYIKPGYKFRVVDHLITNFHLPKTSLLVLVCAFAGREAVLAAYQEAIAARYRFYSYGDAMLIL